MEQYVQQLTANLNACESARQGTLAAFEAAKKDAAHWQSLYNQCDGLLKSHSRIDLQNPPPTPQHWYSFHTPKRRKSRVKIPLNEGSVQEATLKQFSNTTPFLLISHKKGVSSLVRLSFRKQSIVIRIIFFIKRLDFYLRYSSSLSHHFFKFFIGRGCFIFIFCNKPPNIGHFKR